MQSDNAISDGASEIQRGLEAFIPDDDGYYLTVLQRYEPADGKSPAVNRGALLAGPIWAASRGVWGLFWPAMIAETVAIVLFCRAFVAANRDEASATDISLALIAAIGFMATRAVEAVVANRMLFGTYQKWRKQGGATAEINRRRTMIGCALSAFFLILSLLRFGIPAPPKAVVEFPASKELHRAVMLVIDNAVDWMIINFESLFAAITTGVREMLDFLELILIGIPWPLMVFVIVLMARRAAGMRVAVFSALALAYLGVFGYWEKSMSTFSLVLTSALICIVLGLPFGIWCAKSSRVYAVVKPVLDFMQTMPSFVYLIPAVAFFSIGKPPGVFATVIFAMPPMIRLTALGIQQVPSDVKEAALAFGASPRQLLVKVELPLAVPSLMAGANQTIMMSLSMIIVASMIGAGGLGYDVLVALRHLNTGEGFLAGTAIVFCAMILDRIIQGRGEASNR